jgi:hypothetical protein
VSVPDELLWADNSTYKEDSDQGKDQCNLRHGFVCQLSGARMDC